MIFGFISLVLFGQLLFPRVTGWIVFLMAIFLVSALGSSFSFEKQTKPSRGPAEAGAGVRGLEAQWLTFLV